MGSKIPPKKNSTPIKPSEYSTMTHEDEEVQHDISKLQEKLHQIYLSQRATKNEIEVFKKGVEAKMDGLKKGMEANMNGLKKCMDAKMDGLKNGMEDMEEKMKDNMEDMKNDLKGYMEGLKNLIQDMIPNGENIIEEAHDENKINVNHDFMNSNVGSKTHHIPKNDIMKFDGKDPVTWTLHMENIFISIMCKTHKRYALQL